MADGKHRGPEFLRFVKPIIDTLRELGSSGNASEVTDRVIERLGISEAEQKQTNANGQSRIRNQIAWARFYLAKAGLIDSSKYGVWALTQTGRAATLDSSSVLKLFNDVQKQFVLKKGAADAPVPTAGESRDVDLEPAPGDYRIRLLEILRALPPSGFERICQRLLRESGFQQVVVTGKSGDGGIDGHGVLEINPLVTFKVLFQCKRYGDDHPVTSNHIRDFRGAMQGRADKGLVLTTGTFTSDAKKEATRDGVPQIELVDGDKLISLFAKAELGLKPLQTFELVDSFFEEFRTSGPATSAKP